MIFNITVFDNHICKCYNLNICKLLSMGKKCGFLQKKRAENHMQYEVWNTWN